MNNQVLFERRCQDERGEVVGGCRIVFSEQQTRIWIEVYTCCDALDQPVWRHVENCRVNSKDYSDHDCRRISEILLATIWEYAKKEWHLMFEEEFPLPRTICEVDDPFECRRREWQLRLVHACPIAEPYTLKELRQAVGIDRRHYLENWMLEQAWKAIDINDVFYKAFFLTAMAAKVLQLPPMKTTPCV